MKKVKILMIGLLSIIIGMLACKKEVEFKQPQSVPGFDYQVYSNLPYSSNTTIKKTFKGSNGSDEMLYSRYVHV